MARRYENAQVWCPRRPKLSHRNTVGGVENIGWPVMEMAPGSGTGFRAVDVPIFAIRLLLSPHYNVTSEGRQAIARCAFARRVYSGATRHQTGAGAERRRRSGSTQASAKGADAPLSRVRQSLVAPDAPSCKPFKPPAWIRRVRRRQWLMPEEACLSIAQEALLEPITSIHCAPTPLHQLLSTCVPVEYESEKFHF